MAEANVENEDYREAESEQEQNFDGNAGDEIVNYLKKPNRYTEGSGRDEDYGEQEPEHKNHANDFKEINDWWNENHQEQELAKLKKAEEYLNDTYKVFKNGSEYQWNLEVSNFSEYQSHFYATDIVTIEERLPPFVKVLIIIAAAEFILINVMLLRVCK